MGITFKENVSDIRNSKVADVVRELQSYKVNVHIVDPHASAQEVKEEFDIALQEQTDTDYDAVIVAVNHKEYSMLPEKYFKDLLSDKGIFFDVKGIYRGKIKELIYLSL
jgi:UDP-N-acetyl-D-galactosamine dehydrogenase